MPQIPIHNQFGLLIKLLGNYFHFKLLNMDIRTLRLLDMSRQSQKALLPGNWGQSQTHGYVLYNAHHPEISIDVHHSHMADGAGWTCMTRTTHHNGNTSHFTHYRNILAETGHQGTTNVRYSNLHCALRSRGLREEGQERSNWFHHCSLIN